MGHFCRRTSICQRVTGTFTNLGYGRGNNKVFPIVKISLVIDNAIYLFLNIKGNCIGLFYGSTFRVFYIDIYFIGDIVREEFYFGPPTAYGHTEKHEYHDQ